MRDALVKHLLEQYRCLLNAGDAFAPMAGFLCSVFRDHPAYLTWILREENPLGRAGFLGALLNEFRTGASKRTAQECFLQYISPGLLAENLGEATMVHFLLEICTRILDHEFEDQNLSSWGEVKETGNAVEKQVIQKVADCLDELILKKKEGSSKEGAFLATILTKIVSPTGTILNTGFFPLQARAFFHWLLTAGFERLCSKHSCSKHSKNQMGVEERIQRLVAHQVISASETAETAETETGVIDAPDVEMEADSPLPSPNSQAENSPAEHSPAENAAEGSRGENSASSETHGKNRKKKANFSSKLDFAEKIKYWKSKIYSDDRKTYKKHMRAVMTPEQIKAHDYMFRA